MSNIELEKIVKRLESVACKLENLPSLTVHQATVDGGNMKSSSKTKPLTISEFEALLQGPLANFLHLCDKIGADVKTHGVLVQKAFTAQLELLKTASTSAKPSTDSALQALLKPTSDGIASVTNFRESNRRSEFFNHLSAVSEGIPVLGWVAISPAPCPFIKEMQDASQFYTNRVIKDFKDKSTVHVDWTKAWIAIFSELQSFVKKHFTTGLVWSGTTQKSSAPPPPTAAGAPPPPPPPAMAPKPTSCGSSSADAQAALFSEINKGTAVTSGLKKVTDDMKTHKNPNLRLGSTVPDKPTTTTTTGSKQKPTTAGAVGDVKPAETKLDGNKWIVQYHHGNKNIVVSDTALRHSIYVFKCDNSVITVKGKINSIVMDNCQKTALVFDELISGLDIVNCKSVQVQTLGIVPTVNIDKTDGAQIYLSKQSIGAEIVSAKSSEMNVLIPSDNGEMTEMALPEQFKTKIVNGKLVTTCAEDF